MRFEPILSDILNAIVQGVQNRMSTSEVNVIQANLDTYCDAFTNLAHLLRRQFHFKLKVKLIYFYCTSYRYPAQ